MIPIEINILAVFIAAFASMAIGFVWYGVLFGKKWVALSGIKMNSNEDPKAAYLASFIATLVMGYVLSHLIRYLAIETIAHILQFSFWIWLGFIAATQLSDVLFTKKPYSLYFINIGYQLVSITVMTLIISLI